MPWSLLKHLPNISWIIPCPPEEAVDNLTEVCKVSFLPWDMPSEGLKETHLGRSWCGLMWHKFDFGDNSAFLWIASGVVYVKISFDIPAENALFHISSIWATCALITMPWDTTESSSAAHCSGLFKRCCESCTASFNIEIVSQSSSQANFNSLNCDFASSLMDASEASRGLWEESSVAAPLNRVIASTRAYDSSTDDTRSSKDNLIVGNSDIGELAFSNISLVWSLSSTILIDSTDVIRS